MGQKTKVQNMKIRTKACRLQCETTPQVIELPERKNEWGRRFLQLDNLVRNFAVVGGLMLVVIAARNASLPQAQSVFGALTESTGMQWDEKLGKLSFVSNLLPENVRNVWNETPSIEATVPSDGAVVHAWSVQEPYLLIDRSDREIEAVAAGEVMSVAHGLNEEFILRLRHDDQTESIYGNLKDVSVEVGDYVANGTVVGKLLDGHPLAFEVRIDGRSIDPLSVLREKP